MQSYTPFAGQMGASLAGTMPTLGSRQAVQQQEQISLAQLLESYKQAQERGQLGQQMQQSEFVQGSGALGALAQMAQAYMGGKIRRKSGETAVELAERITRAQTEAEQAKALQAQQAKIAEQQQLMDARRKAYGNESEMFALTGEVTKPTRGVPMMTDQGLVIVDPTTNQYQMATPQGQPQARPQQPPQESGGMPVTFDNPDAIPPEVRAAIQANPDGWGSVLDRSQVNIPQARPQQAPLRPYEKPAAASEIEKRVSLARSLGASGEEVKQMVVGRDGAAAGAKPMPTAALKMIQEETNAANSAKSITASIDKHLGRISTGNLDFGPISNKINEGRNYAGASTQQSRNYQEFKSDLEKLRNDSLRLNAGVQTDGDAQRAWNELFANLNDTDYVKQRLQTINELNKRAEGLRRMNIDMIRENYGKSGEPAAPSNGGWSIQKVP